MAWRNQGITGSNNIPLGARRRFGGGKDEAPPDDGGYNPSQPANGFTENNYKRGRSPERSMSMSDHLVIIISDTIQLRLSVTARGVARRGTVGATPQRTRLQG